MTFMSPLNIVPGVAVVIGAASGIGQATVRSLASSGCKGIALLDVNEVKLKTTAADIAKIASPQLTLNTYICDISSERSVEDAFSNVYKDFGRVDYLVNCAGINPLGPKSTELTLQDFDRVQAINSRGPWLCSRAALKIMREQTLDSEAYPHAQIPTHRAQRGSIVNISSIAASIALPNSPAYSISKAGIVALTKSDALDYADSKIRVNAVLPGVIKTAMTTSSPEIEKFHEEVAAQKFTPLRRFAEAEEVADVIAFLAGNKASFVTGAIWEVDGGFLNGRLA